MGIGIVQLPSGISAAAGWLDISSVNNNEINLLFADFGVPSVAFSVRVGKNMTYSIDWGDSTIETLRDDQTTYEHTYTVGSGTLCSKGYTTFKIKIYDATDTITEFTMERHSLSGIEPQYPSLLQIVFGTIGLNAWNTPFDFAGLNCSSLQSITFPSTLDSLSSIQYGFRNLQALQTITMPSSMTSLNNVEGAFEGCYSLKSLTLPSVLDSITTMYQCFKNCYNIQSITMSTSLAALASLEESFYQCYNLQAVSFPASLSAVTNMNNTFYKCRVLKSLTLPNNLTAVEFIEKCFSNCIQLASITNLSTLGRTDVNVSPNLTFENDTNLESISMGAKLYYFDFQGTLPILNKIISIRFSNANSFAEVDSYVNISYCSLNTAALELLLNDLTPSSFNRVITLTGNPGAVPSIGLTVGITEDSKSITVSAPILLSVGMELYAAGINSARLVTMQDSGNTVTRLNHGLPTGKLISFSSINSTTGISIYTPYYIVNPLTDTFQVSATLNGSPLDLTTDGTGEIICQPIIESVNFELMTAELDVPCLATATVSANESILKRSIGHLKNWAVTI